MEDQEKSIFKSKTALGGAIAIAAGIASLFGVTVSPAEQLALVEVATAIASAVGGLIAIYGRSKASKKIK